MGQDETPTIKQYLEESFDYRYSFIGQVVAIQLGFTVFFAGLAVGASVGLTAPCLALSSHPIAVLLAHNSSLLEIMSH